VEVEELNSEPVEELKGNPRRIRLEARDNGSNEINLQAWQDYFPGTRHRQAQSFRPDGSFSYFCLCEYDENLNLVRGATFLQGDLQTETRYLPPDEKGLQEAITVSASGRELQRVITRCDAQGRVVECTNLSETGRAHLTARYADDGNVADGLVTLPDGSEIKLPITPNPVYQVVTRDAEGNWTERITPFATVYRTIEYY